NGVAPETPAKDDDVQKVLSEMLVIRLPPLSNIRRALLLYCTQKFGPIAPIVSGGTGPPPCVRVIVWKLAPTTAVGWARTGEHEANRTSSPTQARRRSIATPDMTTRWGVVEQSLRVQYMLSICAGRPPAKRSA